MGGRLRRWDTPTEPEEPVGGYTGAPGRRRNRLRLLIPVLAMILAAGVVAVVSQRAVRVVDDLAKCRIDTTAMIPQQGTMLGVNLDWERTALGQHRANLGHAPAVVVQFSDIPPTTPRTGNTPSTPPSRYASTAPSCCSPWSRMPGWTR